MVRHLTVMHEQTRNKRDRQSRIFAGDIFHWPKRATCFGLL